MSSIVFDSRVPAAQSAAQPQEAEIMAILQYLQKGANATDEDRRNLSAVFGTGLSFQRDSLVERCVDFVRERGRNLDLETRKKMLELVYLNDEEEVIIEAILHLRVPAGKLDAYRGALAPMVLTAVAQNQGLYFVGCAHRNSLISGETNEAALKKATELGHEAMIKMF